jgi:tetratricopeptide (TPR) repeat protein
MDERVRDFLVVVGYVYLQHGDATNAAAVLEPVCEARRPYDREAARLLAYAFLQLGRFQECLDLTDGLLGGPDPDEPLHLWLFRSRALYGLGRRQEARELWERARKGSR